MSQTYERHLEMAKKALAEKKRHGAPSYHLKKRVQHLEKALSSEFYRHDLDSPQGL